MTGNQGTMETGRWGEEDPRHWPCHLSRLPFPESLLSSPAPCLFCREAAKGIPFSPGSFAVSWGLCHLSGESPPAGSQRVCSPPQARGHAEAQGGAGGAREGLERGAGGTAAGAEDECHHRGREPAAAGRAGQVSAGGPRAAASAFPGPGFRADQLTQHLPREGPVSFLVNRLFLRKPACSQRDGNKVKGVSSWWPGCEGSGVVV